MRIRCSNLVATVVGVLLGTPALAGPAGAAAGTVATAPEKSADATADSAPSPLGPLEKRCLKCHNSDDWAGGLAFDTLAGHDIPADAETWGKGDPQAPRPAHAAAGRAAAGPADRGFLRGGARG